MRSRENKRLKMTSKKRFGAKINAPSPAAHATVRL